MAKAVFDIPADGSSLPPMDGEGVHISHAEGDGFSRIAMMDGRALVMIRSDDTTIAEMTADERNILVETIDDATS